MTAPLVIMLALLPILAVVAGIFVFARGGEKTPANGQGLPLIASFGSQSALGPFGGSHNNLNPRLVLLPDGIEYRVVRLTTSAYSEIASVDVSPGERSSDIILDFVGGYRFTGRTRDRLALAATLRELRGKGCALTDAARAFADAPEASV